jgi:hypothetical protein
MIEIVFSDSACGCLKVAMHGKSGCIGGAVGVCVLHTDGSPPTKEEIEEARRKYEEKERQAWESAIPIGGTSADVFGFNFALSVGDISEDRPGTRRQRVLERLYSIYPKDVGRQAAEVLLQRAEDDLAKVLDRAAKGEELRIWYSNQPDELCGLYWVMAQLNQPEERCGQIYLVKLPEWEADEKGNIIQRICWGEMDPAEWHRYLALQKPASQVFCRSCASHWRTLQEENAPLRAMLNGQLVSAPETLYDDFILREIAAEADTFHEAMVIGRILGKHRLGIGDSWVALRMEEMIRAGTLEAVTAAGEDSPVYHRLLKKCGNL